MQRFGQYMLQHIYRLTEGPATVLKRLNMPAHRNAGPLTTTGEQHTQRTWRQQAAHPAPIARRAGSRLGRGFRLYQDDLAYL